MYGCHSVIPLSSASASTPFNALILSTCPLDITRCICVHISFVERSRTFDRIRNGQSQQPVGTIQRSDRSDQAVFETDPGRIVKRTVPVYPNPNPSLFMFESISSNFFGF